LLTTPVSITQKSKMGFSLRLPGSEKKKEDVSYTAVEVDPNSSNTDISTQHAAVSGWPGSPERISSAPIWIVGDFILLLMPIAFIGETSLKRAPSAEMF
jgi:hypothetical protein